MKTPFLQPLHAEFLAIVPRIEQHGQVHFRNLKCPTTKEECIAEMIALSWQWFIRLKRKGKNPSVFVSAIASFAARPFGVVGGCAARRRPGMCCRPVRRSTRVSPSSDCPTSAPCRATR